MVKRTPIVDDLNVWFGDCEKLLPNLEDDSVDLVCVDPPYGAFFMGRQWDKALPPVGVWKECLRVLKPGAFAFVMSLPRSDLLWRMISRLEEAGFIVSFTPLFWTYASGFPKAQNVGKAVDKRGGISISWFGAWLKRWRIKNRIPQKEIAQLFPSKTGRLTGCVANWELGLNMPTPKQFTTICRHFNLPFENIEEVEREVIGTGVDYGHQGSKTGYGFNDGFDVTRPATPNAKRLDGSYGGFQPKPAVEVIIVAMKPLSEKTFVDQALANRHGITWLGDGRIPHAGMDDEQDACSVRPNALDYPHRGDCEGQKWGMKNKIGRGDLQGRFPANLLVSDDVLNDGRIRKSGTGDGRIGKQKEGAINSWTGKTGKDTPMVYDSGSFSRYFSLDAWVREHLEELPPEPNLTFPFLIVPKASKAEKNSGLSGSGLVAEKAGTDEWHKHKRLGVAHAVQYNIHPTCKPITLMAYLITLGSREGDLVLDPYCGSGTTGCAAIWRKRKYLLIDNDPVSVQISKARLEWYRRNVK